jgi:ATPase family AAA domain-containing protein 2
MSCLDPPLKTVPPGAWSCPLCSGAEDVCAKCGGPGFLVLCDSCPKAFHVNCARLRAVPKGDWHCPDCSGMRMSTRKKKPVTRFRPPESEAQPAQRKSPYEVPSRRRKGKGKARSGGGSRRRRCGHRRRHRHYSRESDSNTDYSSAEEAWERQRGRGMAKARSKVQPINLPDGHTAGGRPNADITPMMVDKNVDWSEVGGLSSHVQSLKEMVVLPLLYPEIFEKFSMAPPRGVLFYGPPGTGKTLVARALANTCSQAGGQQVSFFMRKGADCLSKWVGEAERQLRLLFDQAYRMQPSIIFFDEVRSRSL